MNLASFPLAAAVAVPRSHWDGALAVDLFAPDGTPVLAVFDGYADAYRAPLGGNAITLTAPDGTAAYYAHLSAPGRSGWVRAGEVLGYEGHTGNADKGNGAADSHLHFAIATSGDVIDARNGAGDVAPWDALAGLDAAVESPPDGGGDGAAGTGVLVPVLVAAGALWLLFRLID